MRIRGGVRQMGELTDGLLALSNLSRTSRTAHARIEIGSAIRGDRHRQAIVHKIVARNGGRIWAEAAPGRGATFHFTLGQS